MTKQRKAQIVTLAVIVAGLVLVVGKETGWRMPAGSGQALFSGAEVSDKPADTIYRMLDAGGAGDVTGYLDCFGGQIRKTLEQSVSEMSGSGFARYLVQKDEQIKGIAVYGPFEVTESAVDMRVEYVYADRNEAQRLRLEKLSGRWTITKVDGMERVETLVPYGTPVY